MTGLLWRRWSDVSKQIIQICRYIMQVTDQTESGSKDAANIAWRQKLGVKIPAIAMLCGGRVFVFMV